MRSRAVERSQGGLGIGLTIVRNLIERHGGTVRAHSEGPGKGSEFIVRLPTLAGFRNEVGKFGHDVVKIAENGHAVVVDAFFRLDVLRDGLVLSLWKL